MKCVVRYAKYLILLICGIACGITVVTVAPDVLPKKVLALNPNYAQYVQFKERYEKLNFAYNQLEENYYEKINKKDLEEGMLRGLFKGAGDPYTSYMSAQEYENFMINSKGELQGIGVGLGTDSNDNIIVINVFKDSPAELAGIKQGDIISAVNDIEYKGKNMEKAVSDMRGEAGTKVRITYIREDVSKTVTMIRKKITFQSVYAKELPDGIGYVAIRSFEANTPQEFETELHNFEMNGAKGIVIDLRQNGGGIVDSGIKIADMLLDEGVLAYTRGKNEKEKVFMNTQKGKTSLPYVILIDGGTASTSEIVAAGVKDNNGGKLIGTTSFGKGVIQTIMPLKSHDAMKITVAQYFSPKGSVIQGIGITPDYVVELPEDATSDLQLQKAIEVLKAGR
ncbi:MAG: S41 family peptidase [Eubacteriales bacterium]